MTTVDLTLAPSEPRAFGSLLARVRAMFLDAAIIATGFVGVLLLITIAASVPGSGRVGVAVLLTLLLYEPVCVAWYGGTIGHRRSNLRVVDEQTGENPSFARAALRFLLKSILGLVSFVTMALTRRHQAIHDSLTRTTVEIRDLAVARPEDVRWERESVEVPGLPSKARRSAVIMAYLAAIFIVMSLGLTPFLSQTCSAYNRCTAAEELTSTAMSLAWMSASAWCIIAGWRGKLWGARRGVITPAV